MRRFLRSSTTACALGALALAGGLAVPAEAKVKSVFVKRVLQIQGSKASERVKVVCRNGNAKVNGANPKGGAVPCAKIVEIDAAMGAGKDVIDFSGIRGDFGKARYPGFGVATGAAALGGDGSDRFIASRAAFNIFYGEGGNDRATGGPARDVLSGGPGDDKLNAAGGRDSVLGGGGNDRLLGGRAADLLSGGAGNDKLFGGSGSDILGGGPGRDLLRGGKGRDRLLGGAGRDILGGGPGRDSERQD